MTIRIWQSESEPWENDLRSLANKNQVVDTSMFSLVRDYYILSGALIIIFSKNYQVLWEPVCNGRPRNSVCQHTQWWLICTQLMWMLSALQELEELRASWCPPFVAAGAANPLKPSVPRRVLRTTGDRKKRVRFRFCTCDHILARSGCRFHGFKLIQFVLHEYAHWVLSE